MAITVAILLSIVLTFCVAILSYNATEEEKAKAGGAVLGACFCMIVLGAILALMHQSGQGYPQDLNSSYIPSNIIVEVIHEVEIAGKHLVVIRGPSIEEESWRIFSIEGKESVGVGLRKTTCNRFGCNLEKVVSTNSPPH